jgi:hypothetical protein
VPYLVYVRCYSLFSSGCILRVATAARRILGTWDSDSCSGVLLPFREDPF